MDHWASRRSDPDGAHLILSIEPNGAPPRVALSKTLKHRWDAVREVILNARELRCEKCGIRVEPETASYLHVHENWLHTEDKTALDPHLGWICRDCHNVMHLIWVQHTLPLGMDRFRKHFCVVNGVDGKEFARHLKWAAKASSPAVPPPADYGVWSALFDVKGREATQVAARSILKRLPRRSIDKSHWLAIEARRQALAQLKAEETRKEIEKAAHKTERERRKHDRLVRLGLISPHPSRDRFDLEPLMEAAMEVYGDWRI